VADGDGDPVESVRNPSGMVGDGRVPGTCVEFWLVGAVSGAACEPHPVTRTASSTTPVRDGVRRGEMCTDPPRPGPDDRTGSDHDPVEPPGLSEE
jgi:hypothetical protein